MTAPPRSPGCPRRRVWSVTVYNRDLAVVKNSYDAYIVNSVTATPNEDGSVTIHFGGDPDQPNYIYTPEGWRYLVRLCGTRQSIIDGSYQFPKPQPGQGSRARATRLHTPRTVPPHRRTARVAGRSSIPPSGAVGSSLPGPGGNGHGVGDPGNRLGALDIPRSNRVKWAGCGAFWALSTMWTDMQR